VKITYLPSSAAHFDAVARLWHDIFINTHPHLTSHRDLEGYRYILREHVLIECDQTVATDDLSVIGFLALKPNFIDQLYVSRDYQARSIGSKSVKIAKDAYPDELWLFTLASNKRAIRFYNKHGFEILSNSIAPDEGILDVRMIWQQGFHV
jgi:ribosomal protein S18 acetylase RimI-like enzyme